MKRTILRKLLVTICTFIITPLLISLITFIAGDASFSFVERVVSAFLIFSIYVAPVLFLYVLPVSVLSEYVSRRYRYRCLVSFFIHMGFSIVFFSLFLLIPIFDHRSEAVYNTLDRFVLFLSYTINIIFFLYWLVDELFLRLWGDRRQQFKK
ncbi:hypothetical protein SAMN05444487_11328 [Marininema mesophilum]|uniref:Uncharacterized protein n=1 Tax=Marininema mesophilum TaxID=1048340 RepID=A0A1H3ABR0_9BACL|nr:hypothetical protein [Marininema mesophilum]SDX27073.1 hypothetical protein SAMN05444487_11328 [Marininema mesophilum]